VETDNKMKKAPTIFIIAFLLADLLNVSGQYYWRTKNCLPNTHLFPVMFSLDSLGYVIGGSNGVNAYEANQVWVYDAATNTFTQKNNFPRKIFAGSGFVINGVAYAGIGSDSGFDYKNDFWKYDQNSDQWTQIADFPGAARYAAMSFSIGNYGYVGCGYNGGEFNDFYKYDPSSDTWTQVSNFPGAARQTGLGISIGEFGYMGLGYIGGSANVQDMYQYNPVLDSWSQIADFPDTARDGSGSFVISDSFYVAAGGNYPFTDYYNDCWRYDPSTDTWARQEDLACVSQAYRNYGGFTLNGHGYILNGEFGNSNFGKTLLEFGPLDTTFIHQVRVLGNDTSFCSSFSQTLSTHNPCTIWSTGVVDSQIVVSVPGTYWASWADACGMEGDAIHISSGNFPVSLSIQNSTCGVHNGAATVSSYGGYPPFMYIWSNGDTSSTISNLSSGIYAVTVSDVDGCSSTATAIVDSTTIGNILLETDSTSFCAGQGTQLCAPAGFVSYQWNTGQSTSCIYAQEAGDYYVTVSNGGDCSAVSNHLLLYVLPIPIVSISVSGDTLTCYNGTSYQWYFDGIAVTGADSGTYIANNPGEYMAVVSDSNGCTSQSNDVKIFATDISIVEEGENISIYPNPLISGLWHLHINSNFIGNELEIMDDNGRTIFRQKIKTTFSEIPMEFASGVYFLRVSLPHNMLIRKLVKLN
jgi:hypothetical protein